MRSVSLFCLCVFWYIFLKIPSSLLFLFCILIFFFYFKFFEYERIINYIIVWPVEQLFVLLLKLAYQEGNFLRFSISSPVHCSISFWLITAHVVSQLFYKRQLETPPHKPTRRSLGWSFLFLTHNHVWTLYYIIFSVLNSYLNLKVTMPFFYFSCKFITIIHPSLHVYFFPSSWSSKTLIPIPPHPVLLASSQMFLLNFSALFTCKRKKIKIYIFFLAEKPVSIERCKQRWISYKHPACFVSISPSLILFKS